MFMHVKAKTMAFSGLLLALTVIFMVLGSVIETSTLFLLAAASFFVGIIIREFGLRIGAAFYAAGVEQGVADGSARLWLPERRKGAFCKKCLQNRCNLKKNINKGCYAWLILQKMLLLDRKQQMRRFCMKNHKTWAWICVFCFFMTMLTGYKRK